MSQLEVPLHIKKTFATLKAQMERAEIDRTYTVSSHSITYTSTLQQSQIIPIENIKRPSEAQHLYQKMSIFLEELRQKRSNNQQILEPNGATWKEKLISTCAYLSSGHVNHPSQLLYYYSIGYLLEQKAWKKEAKNFLKYLTSSRYQDILTIAQRTYFLYQARGPSHIFAARQITPYILQRMWKEDYNVLKEKAHEITQSKLKEVLLVTDFAGAQSQEAAYVMD
ncbi:hypothetical protein C2G38_2245130 [Gigaspora rosea]|uniref:Uncharacterized protein n=1 Tax=Gigaspora rosea TaxID=44941 RepID=A0A397VHZ8_9GLOM|nr:hypothetical protein C2G38_2245130 [Gigaspora rosea]